MRPADPTRQKTDLIKQVRTAEAVVGLFAGLLAAIFGWLQFKEIDFGPLTHDLSARAVFRLALFLYYAAWATGLPWDACEQELVYVKGPGQRRVLRDSLAIGGLVTGLFFLMLWVDSYQTFAIFLALFLVLNVIAWLYLVKIILPDIVASSETHYATWTNYIGLEQLHLVFTRYLTGAWQWWRFGTGALLILIINILASTTLAAAAGPKLALSADMCISLTILLYVAVMEGWIWIWRLRVKAGLWQLEDIRDKYDLTPSAPPTSDVMPVQPYPPGSVRETPLSEDQIAGPKPTDSTSRVTTGLLILSIYAYFAGWLYEFYFLDDLGLSIYSTDIAPYYFFVYSYFVLPQRLSLQVGLSAAAVVLVLVALFVWRLSGRARLLLAVVGVLTLTIFAPALIFTAAQREGTYQARRLRAGETAHRVRLVIAKDALARYPPAFIDTNSRYELHLVAETKDRFYVFHPDGVGEPHQLSTGTTYSIAKSDIVLTEVKLQNVGRPHPE